MVIFDAMNCFLMGNLVSSCLSLIDLNNKHVLWKIHLGGGRSAGFVAVSDFPGGMVLASTCGNNALLTQICVHCISNYLNQLYNFFKCNDSNLAVWSYSFQFPLFSLHAGEDVPPSPIGPPCEVPSCPQIFVLESQNIYASQLHLSSPVHASHYISHTCFAKHCQKCWMFSQPG